MLTKKRQMKMAQEGSDMPGGRDARTKFVEELGTTEGCMEAKALCMRKRTAASLQLDL